MARWLDLRTLELASPDALWLLAAPGLLALLWLWQAGRRARDRARLGRGRVSPLRERIPLLGGLGFWACAIAAIALVIVALAGPRALVAVTRTSGIDLVILQDGSASMRVADVPGTRWQQATRFLRALGETVSWDRDRLAMAVFARIATPQVRLTHDPNTFFFFIDHLGVESPFRLEDDSSWDTNIESGLYWGMRLFERDEQLHGRSPNAKAFVLISDGQAWSGEVAGALTAAVLHGIPVWVVGVGTPGGGPIPDPPPIDGQPAPPLRSQLDRASLQAIATRGRGQYLELGRDSDRSVAARLVLGVRRDATGGVERTFRELHWPVLAAAAAVLLAGVLFLQERTELLLHALGAGAVLAWLLGLTG